MRPENWTLMAIAAAGGKGLSPVQLQKTLFLLGRHFEGQLGEGFYTFEPYNYGPFDAKIYRDAEALADMRLVAINRQPGQRWAMYTATVEGAEYAQRLEGEAPAKAVKYLHEVVAWAMRLNFQDLVRSIYEAYPDFRANSVFQD